MVSLSIDSQPLTWWQQKSFTPLATGSWSELALELTSWASCQVLERRHHNRGPKKLKACYSNVAFILMSVIPIHTICSKMITLFPCSSKIVPESRSAFCSLLPLLMGSMNSAFSTLLKVRYWRYVIDPNPHLITYLNPNPILRYVIRYLKRPLS